MSETQQNVTIGALSRQASVPMETVRYYERSGLMPKPPRSGGGHRLYNRDHLKRLVFIRRGRELGFSLKELRALLGLVDGGNYTCGEVKALSDRHRVDVCQKIADLRRLEKISITIMTAYSTGTRPKAILLSLIISTASI